MEVKKYFSILCFILFALSVLAQEKYTISGYITDINNGESIVGANIYCKELNLGVTSNTYGFYSLTLPSGTYNISYTFIGYKSENKSFIFSSFILLILISFFLK